MRRITKKATVSLVAAGALAVGGAGAAFAYWTTSGSGTGTATTATGGASLTFGATTADGTAALTAMFPGDSAQSFQASVTNGGSSNAHVSGVKAYLSIDSAHAAACSADDYLLASAAGTLAAAPGAATDAIPLSFTATDLAPSGSAVASGKIQFNNKAGVSQDGCKGATVTINYVAE